MANDPLRAIRKAQQLVADEYNKHRPDGVKPITPDAVQILDFTRGPTVGRWSAILGTELEDNTDRQYRVLYDNKKQCTYVNTFRLERTTCVYDAGDLSHNWTQEF